MPHKPSRRHCLVQLACALAATPSTLVARPVLAADPPRIAQSIPIHSRSIRLDDNGRSGVVVTAVAIDSRGEWLAAAGDDNQIRLIDPADLTVQATLAGHLDRIRTLTFDRSGQYLASAGHDGQIIVHRHDPTNQRFGLHRVIESDTTIACLRFSPDATRIAAVGFDNRIMLHGENQATTMQLRCDCRDLRALSYRDDHQQLAVAGRSGEVHLYDPNDGRLISEQPLHRGRIHAVAFRPDSNLLLSTGEDGVLVIFDTRLSRIRQRISVTSGKLFALALLDSQTVAVAGSDNEIHVVDTGSATTTRKLSGHAGSIAALAAGNGFLFSGSFDATLRQWAISDVVGQSTRIAEADRPQRTNQ